AEVLAARIPVFVAVADGTAGGVDHVVRRRVGAGIDLVGDAVLVRVADRRIGEPDARCERHSQHQGERDDGPTAHMPWTAPHVPGTSADIAADSRRHDVTRVTERYA